MLFFHYVAAKVATAVTGAPPPAALTPSSSFSSPSSSSSSSSSPSSSLLRAPLQPGETEADYEMPAFVQKLISWIDYFRTDEGRVYRKKIILGIVLGGSAAVFYRWYRARQRHRAKHHEHKLTKTQLMFGDKPRDRVAVNRIFFGRLLKILRIVIPSASSTEMGYIIILTILLVARTIFSIYIAELIGLNAQSLVGRKWGRMWGGIKSFALITIPASMVNSGLKYCTEMISLRFRVRLSEHVHNEYLKGVNFYICSNLGKDKIENADQRVTADIKDFSDEISQLYSSMLKPTLDVLLFTYKLGSILGWQGPVCMHLYFMLAGFVKKRIIPNLGKMVAKESELEGHYRTAHQRLITNSEEVAFYDGSAKEKIIINHCLHDIEKHVSFARYLKACIGVFDGLLVKYYASIAGYLTLLSPFVFNLESSRSKSSEELTRDYIRNSQYLGNLSTAVGQLVIVGNKLTQIAGYTSRVSELLEMVKDLDNKGDEPFGVKEEENKKEEPCSIEGIDQWLIDWRKRCDQQHQQRIAVRRANRVERKHNTIKGGKIIEGENIEFKDVDIVSPDGKLLVSKLNFEVKPGFNTMVTGPNGCGKSSLFRLIGELWPLSSGELIRPPKEAILFVPQKPYLVLGTLRDQIIYPHTLKDMQSLGITDDDLLHLLATVDPAQNIIKEWKFDDRRDWWHAFSGGQKQRVAMARLMYHRPKFAILDECTSAVSDEVEDNIYQTCKKLGITIFTVSHRPSLARHHELILRFEGQGLWTVTETKKTTTGQETPRK